ncbi:Gx transporter family protein [Paenibacillus sp. MSJ-34]|uniref:Gx transporter family protein n=1 Tax=Paenibacillus sp. MSJ-34 TaxID=2841529 RepID=UPI001C1266CD|nr:Gx transporter family protein [Paenibacillus sp. MSJ-34]MBU5440682.1 Gx transporter family protein [Paenibacillus sp. MSJ-34]
MPSFRESHDAAAGLKRIVAVAIFAAAAVVLGVMESIIPVNFSVPGAKLGLANIMVLTCLYFLRGRDTLLLVALKTILTALVFGTFSSFLFSLFGSLFSFAVMYILMAVSGKRLSLIGVSIAGGIAHNIGQLAAAGIVIRSSTVFYYLPVLLLTGVATGIFVGIAAKYAIRALSQIPLFEGWGEHD